MTSAYLDRPLRTYKQALKERKTDRGLLNFLTYQAICALPEHRKNELRRAPMTLGVGHMRRVV